jgi:hypothetical protein
MLTNAAVFINAVRKFKNVIVEFDDTEVVVKNRQNQSVMATYKIEETAKEGMAWDTLDARGDRVRLVAQEGCGCSGMLRYNNDDSYSGALKHK